MGALKAAFLKNVFVPQSRAALYEDNGPGIEVAQVNTELLDSFGKKIAEALLRWMMFFSFCLLN